MRFRSTVFLLIAVLLAAWDNLDLGIPGPCDQIVAREGYALGYSEKYEQPLWVSYHLTADEVTNAVLGRMGTFYADPAITTGSALPSDYDHSGYDRGHLAPAADMRFSTNVLRESFSMANVCPQLPAFNRGAWKRLEEHVRDVAKQEGDVFVVTGPVFDTNAAPRAIGVSRVRVPDAFFKVLCITSEPVRTVGYLLPHDGSAVFSNAITASVDVINEKTGLSVPQL